MLLNTGGFWSGSGVPSDMVQDDLGEGAGAGALGTGPWVGALRLPIFCVFQVLSPSLCWV